MADQHHPLGAKRNHADLLGNDRIGDDAQIDFRIEHRFVDPAGMEEFEPDSGLGVAPHEILHRAAHVVKPHRVDRRHADDARDLLPQRPHSRFDRVVRLEHLAEPLVAGLPFGSEHEGPLAPVDQLDAEVLLHAPDRLRCRRLAHVVGRRPAGEALVLDHVAEDSQRFKVHAGILS